MSKEEKANTNWKYFEFIENFSLVSSKIFLNELLLFNMSLNLLSLMGEQIQL